MAAAVNEISQLPCLPFEIQDTILRNLTFRECVLLSAVCKTWRSMVLNWQGMWSTLSTKDNHDIASALVPYRAFITSTSVNRVYLDTELNKHLEAVIDFLATQQCTAIQKVDIRAPIISNMCLLDLSTMCADTLSDVSLSLVDRNPHNVTPDMPMLYFPNMKKFYYSGRVSEAVHPVLTGIQNHRLVDMAISIYIDAGEFDVKPFLEAAPRLQRLCLNFESIMFTGGAIPSMVRQYCPKLASLVIVNEMGNSSGNIAQDVKNEILKINDPGLPRLVLRDRNRCFPVAQQILYQIGQDMCEQLEHMELTGHTVLGEQHAVYLSTLRFPLLTYLVLTNAPYYCSTSLCAFLSRSVPNLAYLELVGLGCADDGILCALASTGRCLQVLTLDSCLHITSSGLVTFIKTLSRHKCLLKQITLRAMPSVSQELLDTLASTTEPIVLDELTIDGCHSLSIDDYTRALAMPGTFGGIKKLCISLYYMGIKLFPHKDAIKRLLGELNSRITQWKFSLVSYIPPPHSLDLRNYWYMDIDHVKYQKRLKDGAL
ncbi:hypothetical protein BJV82DRAFT_673126 [Fennellomyces sp. T-0311]|nr:hypothetical protein BJV82DRAFT_673126 [Fennellomyces sp. T-0311]